MAATSSSKTQLSPAQHKRELLQPHTCSRVTRRTGVCCRSEPQASTHKARAGTPLSCRCRGNRLAARDVITGNLKDGRRRSRASTLCPAPEPRQSGPDSHPCGGALSARAEPPFRSVGAPCEASTLSRGLGRSDLSTSLPKKRKRRRPSVPRPSPSSCARCTPRRSTAGRATERPAWRGCRRSSSPASSTAPACVKLLPDGACSACTHIYRRLLLVLHRSRKPFPGCV